MRLIVIEIETTGISPEDGDKIVEIGAIAIEHGKIHPDDTFHRFVDPQREIPREISQIHGIDAALLAAKEARPFAEIGTEFLAFIAGSTLVFHNAKFDLGFITKALADAGLPNIDDMPVIDTLTMARQCFPKQRHNIEALCDLLEIDRNHIESFDALTEATLIARCFIVLINQSSQQAAGNETPRDSTDAPKARVADAHR